MAEPSFTTELPDAEIARIVREKLPRWQAACDHAKGDIVVLHRSAFTNSPDELLLMGIAIKYAGLAKKDVTICH